MITTVCMNPSFDKTAIVDSIQTGQLNVLEDVRYDAGGKGINVALVLKRLGVETACVGCLGQTDEHAFLSLLQKEGLPFHPLSLPGKIRTNLKIMERSRHTVTEFNEMGLAMDQAQQDDFLALLKKKARDSQYVVLSGRLPVGCADTTYQKCMQTLSGIPCVLDAAGDALLYGLKEMPFLIKPNLPELEAIMHKELRTLRSIRDAALTLIGYGAQNVVVSMGKYGAMVTDGGQTYFSPALAVGVKSTVGAGDAMVAGILYGLSQGATIYEAFRHGVAAGAASVTMDGTQPLQKNTFTQLLAKATLQKV